MMPIWQWKRTVPWLGAGAGFAVGVVVSRSISMAAKPGQLPGIAATLGFDPRGYLWRLVALISCTIAGGFLAAAMTGLAPSDRSEGTQTFPKVDGLGFLLAAAVAHAITAWMFLVRTSIANHIPAAFLLLLLVAVSGVLAAALGRGHPEKGAAFLSTGALLLPVALRSGRPVGIDGICVGAAFLLPPLAWLLFRENVRTAKFLRALTIVVLLPGSITVLSATSQMRAWATANLFEDGHALLPASEYLRGELPYRDIIPGHGLVSDGLLAAAQLKAFGDDYGGLHRGEMAVGALFWPSLYALALAATGNAAPAFAALAISNVYLPQYYHLRLLPSLWVLALAILASRSGNRRTWLACGALIPIALLVAVEFAAYAAGAALVALWVARGPRWKALAAFLGGGLATSAGIAVSLAAKGLLVPFVRTTFFYLPTLMPVYGIPLVRPELPWSSAYPTLAAWISDPTMFLYGYIVLAVLVLAAVLPNGPRLSDRARAALPILAWTVFAMLSVVERRHVRYPMFLVPLALLLLALWFKGPRRWFSGRGVLAAACVAGAALLWRPADVVNGSGYALAHPEPPRLATFEEPRRARGALFPPTDEVLVRATSALIEKARLSPTDTWLDFANAPGLHYLFDRDCPIRYYEVPFYESEAAQADVIEALERNPRVRAVLLKTSLFSDPIDGVPNMARAPKVAKYLELNFEPFLAQDGVEFWLRRPKP